MRETGLKKRKEVALAAWDDPERSEYLDDFDGFIVSSVAMNFDSFAIL